MIAIVILVVCILPQAEKSLEYSTVHFNYKIVAVAFAT